MLWAFPIVQTFECCPHVVRPLDRGQVHTFNAADFFQMFDTICLVLMIWASLELPYSEHLDLAKSKIAASLGLVITLQGLCLERMYIAHTCAKGLSIQKADLFCF